MIDKLLVIGAYAIPAILLLLFCTCIGVEYLLLFLFW